MRKRPHVFLLIWPILHMVAIVWATIMVILSDNLILVFPVAFICGDHFYEQKERLDRWFNA